jgi:hypothetical protein
MKSTRGITVLAVALLTTLASTEARAHWCDDLWSSAYNIIVRPDNDTSPKELYVENHWGYQLTNFKLTATSSSGGTVTLTPPTTLKVKDTLLPGEKGTWKITAGNPAKIEDLSFHVTFGNTSGALNKQYACYPVLGGSPVMVIKKDGVTRFPSAVTAIPKDGTDPKPNTPNGCTYGDVALGRSLQLQTIADWEDLNVGLDNMLVLYCAGRGSWGNNDKTVKPNTYCKDGNNTTCPAKATPIPGSRSDYMRLWGAGALAIRKASLGDARMKTFRQRLKCGINDADPGISGYTMFVLGYLGDDADSKTFLQSQASASGDTGAIAKAALYLMGDTGQKSAVESGAKSSSVWVKVACSGALGIVDKNDDAVTTGIIPEVKWIEPDNMGGETDNGKGMYSAHILEIVAADRRGWVHKGAGPGAVTFYGETPSSPGGSGGNSGAGGTTGAGGGPGSAGASSSSKSGGGSTGGAVIGSGGAASGAGASANGGSVSSSSAALPGGSSDAGGASSSAGNPASSSESKSSGSTSTPNSGGKQEQGSSASEQGGSSGSNQDSSGHKVAADSGNGCGCNLGGRAPLSTLLLPMMIGLAFLRLRRRR